VNRTRAVGIGVFVIGGALLFTVALFMIGNRRMLFADTFTVYTELKSLGGIQSGSSVRVSGMVAGEIKDIEVPSTPAGSFRLRMELREELHGLVRTDSVAAIRTEGLVGAQFLQIGSGTPQAKRVPDGGTIKGQEPFEISDLMQQMSDTIRIVNSTIADEISDLMQQMSDTIRIVNSTIADLRGDVERTIGTIDDVATNANGLIQDISGPAKTIAASGARVADDLRALTDGVRAGRGTVGRLFNDDALAHQILDIARDARESTQRLRMLVEQAQQAFNDATGKGGSVQGLSASLHTTLEKTQQTMDNLAADTEALKRNFLFRGYFNDRGYYSLSDLSPLEYRRGALEKNGRKPVRIWLRADVLFAPDSNGVEVLTDEGRARLDSAMGEFLKYRGTAPLVVEGYADLASESDRYLRSRARAGDVRSYLVERFQLDRSSTAAIALGTAAASPSGERWDGVALALFVDGRALDKE
jgi:phospholipid/cholesterol/gamma-HCH transport system substrate-binding protein